MHIHYNCLLHQAKLLILNKSVHSTKYVTLTPVIKVKLHITFILLMNFLPYMAEDLKLQLQAEKMWLYVVSTVLNIYVVKLKVIIFAIHLHYL
jgi:hypothetical protein